MGVTKNLPKKYRPGFWEEPSPLILSGGDLETGSVTVYESVNCVNNGIDEGFKES